jgi:hypothetical protein
MRRLRYRKQLVDKSASPDPCAIKQPTDIAHCHTPTAGIDMSAPSLRVREKAIEDYEEAP